MTTGEILIIAGGSLSMLMAVFHCLFYKTFGWENEFRKIQLANKRIFFTIHLFLIVFFVFFALVSFLYYRELALCNGLAFGVVSGYSCFWLIRLIWQIFYFKYPAKVTALHYAVILFFCFLFITYFIPLFLKLTVI